MKNKIKSWLLEVFSSNLKKEIETLTIENNDLMKVNARLEIGVEFLERNLNEYQREFSIINEEVGNMIRSSLVNLGSYEKYELLKELDAEGWYVYEASKEILGLDKNWYTEKWYTEENMGVFAEADGYKLKHWAEIAAFGDCSYRDIGNGYEILDTYSIDYNSEKYKEYIDKLYNHPAIEKIIDKNRSKKDITEKLQWLQNLPTEKLENQPNVYTIKMEQDKEFGHDEVIKVSGNVFNNNDWELEI